MSLSRQKPLEATSTVPEKPAIDPATVAPGRGVRRRPGGRGCTVDEVSGDRQKVRIRDVNLRFWVNMDTLVKKWY